MQSRRGGGYRQAILASAISSKFAFKLLYLGPAGGRAGFHDLQDRGVLFLSVRGPVGKLQFEFCFRQRHRSTSRSLARRSESESLTPPSACPLINNGPARVAPAQELEPVGPRLVPNNPFGPPATDPNHSG